ncbi:hypothetical protein [Streptomyces sp. NPDC051993]|uniref:hypothetical protein n=1 Tax=Streptomyces sp. NPDC051993 TaxID=3155286 RepID=UPI00341C41B3
MTDRTPEGGQPAGQGEPIDLRKTLGDEVFDDAEQAMRSAAAAPEPVEVEGAPANAVPTGLELGQDLAGDTPLIPAWTKTREGWKHRARVVRRRRARAARHWARRQKTEHGHTAQIIRGGKRIRAWVRGVEGIQVQAAEHQAHIASKKAEQAARRVRWMMIPTAAKKQAQGEADRAMTASVGAMNTYKTARKDMRNKRWGRRAAAYGGPVGGMVAAYLTGGELGLAAAALGMCCVTALIGRKADSGDTWNAGRASLGDGDAMTDEMLNRTFREVGLIKEEHLLKLVTPCHLDGAAWRAIIDLPGGVTFKDVKAKEEKLAGALGIDRAQLDIQKVDREDRISVWAADSDPFKKARRSPLVGTVERINTWRNGIPMAFGKRGELIHATISDYSYLLAGVTRSGKGMGVANILAGAMLDPRINIRLFDGKGTGEYVGVAPALATFVRRNPARLLDFLLVLHAEMNRRADILVELGISKATEELLDKLGGIELVIVDELATYTAKKGPAGEFAEEITELLAQIAAAGAACGIVLVLATQVPESDIVPTRLRANCAARWAMRTESADSSNVILGKGKAGDGYDSSQIGITTDQRGRGWLVTPDTGFIEARSLFIDEKKGELLTVMGAGLKIRAEFGSLPGYFNDPVESAMRRITGASSVAGGPSGKGGIVRETVLDHMLKAAASTGEGNVTKAEVFAHLATIDAKTYGRSEGESDAAHSGRAGKALAAALKDLGAELTGSKLTRGSSRPEGWTVKAIEDAIAARSARK